MPSNPDRRIKLTVSTQSVFRTGTTIDYKLVVTASDGNLMPNEIFLFHHVDPITGYPDGREDFKGICTPSQLSFLPVNEPADNSEDNYYRSATVTLTLTNREAADSAWLDIISEVRKLKLSLDYGDGLTQTTFWVGTPPA